MRSGALVHAVVRRCDAIRRGVNPHEPPKSHIFGLCCGVADAAVHLGTPVALRLRTVGTAVAFDLLLETHKGTSSILLETERPAVQVQKLVEISVDVRILRPDCPVIPISDLRDRPGVQGIDLEWDIEDTSRP